MRSGTRSQWKSSSCIATIIRGIDAAILGEYREVRVTSGHVNRLIIEKYSDNTDEYEDDDDYDYNNNPTISVMATLPDYRLSYNMVANSYFGHSTGTSANIS